MSGKPQEVIIIYDADGNEVSRTVKDIESTTGTETGTGTGTGTPTVPPYVYTPGATAPTNGSAMDYAAWLQGHTKDQAEQDSLRQQQAIETQRQKSVIDANNAYKTGLATYGANAEKMASMGLTGSGYGEYLTGKAYATQRADINAANSLAAQRKDEVLYQERVAKDNADQLYAQNMIEIGNQQNTNYGAIYDAVLNGATLDSVMQDARWSTLSTEQQQLITRTANANVLQGMLDSGKSLDEVKSDSRWATLTPDMQTKLESNYNESVKLETETNLAEFESNYATWLANIKSGALTLDELKNLDAYKKMAADPNGATFITQLEAAQTDYNTAYNAKAKEELDITADLTDDAIKQWADKYNVDEATVNEVKAERTKNVNETISGNITKMTELTDPDEKNAAMDEILSEIEVNFAKGYISKKERQGHYAEIVGNYIDNLDQVSIEDAIDAEKDYKALVTEGKLSYKDYNDLVKNMYSKVGKAVSVSGTKVARETKQQNGVSFEPGKVTIGGTTTTVVEGFDYTINGTTYQTTVDKNKKANKETAQILDFVAKNKAKNGETVLVGDTVYVYDNDGWYQLEKKAGMGAFVKAIS